MRTSMSLAIAAAVTTLTFAQGAWAQQPEQYQPPPDPSMQQQPGYPQQGVPQGQPMDPNYPMYPPPPMYQPPPRTLVRYELRPRYGLIAGGASMLGVAWAVTAVAGLATVAANDICDVSLASTGCTQAAWPLFVPVAGPWIEMAYINGQGTNTARVLLAFDGVIQAGGLAMIIAGAVARRRVPIYADRVHVMPYASSTGSGLAMAGRF